MSTFLKSNVFAASAAAAMLAGVFGAGGYVTGAHAAAREVSRPPLGAPLAATPPSFANLIQRVGPAVVSIDVTVRGGRQDVQFSGDGTPFQFFFGPQGKNGRGAEGMPQIPGFPGFPFPNMRQGAPEGRSLPTERATGSGFFISPDGYIVTNNHVVEGATSITVRLADKRELKGRLVGRDPATDLAVVKVDGTGFSYVSFEDQAKPRVGDWVIAVGNPYDLGGTATAGIVSALGRQNVSGSGFVDYMQIDAPINRGNSGGPTFDVYGRVVGVNSAIYSPSGGSVGIGFAIPSDVAQAVTRQLIAHGHVERGYIGATVQNVSADIAASLGLKPNEGALVSEFTPGGPAARAGLQVGDVIVAVDGVPVGTSSALTQRIALVRAGQEIRLQVLRNGRPATVLVRSGLRPSEAQLAKADIGHGDDADQAGPTRAGAPVLGMNLAPLTEAARQRFGLGDARSGALVEDVGQGSDAAEKGVQPGDLILRAGLTPVASPRDVSAAVAEAKRSGRPSVLLLVSRNGQNVFIPVKVNQANG